MQRDVSTTLTLDVRGPADLVLAVAVARGAYDVAETLSVVHDGTPLDVEEIRTGHGTRVHRVLAPVGRVVVDYRATVTGQDDVAPVTPADLVEYLLPSRYVESDRLLAFAADQFGRLAGPELLAAVVAWVRQHLVYLAGSSLPTDGATDTLLKRRGVCRDFAHLVVALLRARDVPARMVAVYAPGLTPMDFHAVVEAYVDGGWQVVDATGLAPRRYLLRIATGRDATDTAFLSTYRSEVLLQSMSVSAVVDGVFVTDDGTARTDLR